MVVKGYFSHLEKKYLHIKLFILDVGEDALSTTAGKIIWIQNKKKTGTLEQPLYLFSLSLHLLTELFLNSYIYICKKISVATIILAKVHSVCSNSYTDHRIINPT